MSADQPMYARTEDVQRRYQISRASTARRLMDSTGQTIKVGRRLLVPFSALDEYDRNARAHRHDGGYQPGAWRQQINPPHR